MRRLRLAVVAVVAGIMLAAAPTAGAATATASCYGPGLYGNTTANGTTLWPSTQGIAHKTWRLGTIVVLVSGGQATVTRVIDRGPFVRGRDVDVTAATARKLGYRSCAVFGVRRILIWKVNT